MAEKIVVESDEADIIELVEFFKKKPPKRKPDILDCGSKDTYVLKGIIWNKYHNDKVDIGDGFDDKRFEKYLGEDY